MKYKVQYLSTSAETAWVELSLLQSYVRFSFSLEDGEEMIIWIKVLGAVWRDWRLNNMGSFMLYMIPDVHWHNDHGGSSWPCP